MSYEFRVAQSTEAQAIADLVNSAYRGESSRKGWTTEADLLGGQRIDASGICEIIKQENGALLLAIESEKIMGCVHVRKISSHTAYLGMLTVAPDQQSKGLGKLLLQATEKFCSTQWHCSEMEMTVITSRDELINWYKRRNYELTGETRPFPMDDPKFGIPLVLNIEFSVLKKKI
ncbi:MAG: GNAT family N-acetyltransferase [Oligoflexia bacterium]|nr:GNAT family N-acetyltransferase [Oligoflexia bacterium]